MKLRDLITKSFLKLYISSMVLLFIIGIILGLLVLEKTKSKIREVQRDIYGNFVEEISAELNEFDEDLAQILMLYLEGLKSLSSQYERHDSLNSFSNNKIGELKFSKVTEVPEYVPLEKMSQFDYFIYNTVSSTGIYKTVYLIVDGDVFKANISRAFNRQMFQKIQNFLKPFGVTNLVVVNSQAEPIFVQVRNPNEKDVILQKLTLFSRTIINAKHVMREETNFFSSRIRVFGATQLDFGKSVVEPVYYYIEYRLDNYIFTVYLALGLIILATLLTITTVARLSSKISAQLTLPFSKLIESMKEFSMNKVYNPNALDTEIDEIEEIADEYNKLVQEIQASFEEILAMNEALENSFSKLLELERQTEQAYISFAHQLSVIAENYDEATGNHIDRVGELSAYLADKLGMEPEFVEKIRIFAPLHDVGKILVPNDILNKPGKLTDEEFELMKKHVEYGGKLLGDSEYFKIARNIALYHHEKWDGSGYTKGLKGEEIPIEARIVALVDVYDALRSERPYKKALSHEEALRIILEGDGRTIPEHFDPKLLEILRQNSEEIKELWNDINNRK
ncbi:HD-GYP domain-containing protein [Fervidobacterium sp.]